MMDEDIKTQMLERRRDMASQCREMPDFWQANKFRVVANGIDITSAEQAATEARIAHLHRLIAAVEGSDTPPPE